MKLCLDRLGAFRPVAAPGPSLRPGPCTMSLSLVVCCGPGEATTSGLPSRGTSRIPCDGKRSLGVERREVTLSHLALLVDHRDEGPGRRDLRSGPQRSP